MRWSTRFRERLVLGQVRHSLEDGERILAWAHVRVPGVRAPGVVLVTPRRCMVHVATRDVDDRISPWVGLEGWRLEQPARSRARLTLVTEAGEAVSEFSLTSRRRAGAASRLLGAISECTDVPCDASVSEWTTGRSEASSVPLLHAPPRRLRDHARRVAVTVLGVAVLLVSLIFASPFVPGPGALTAVAGIAILAREYEWARDLHVWASRQVERFIAWLRRRRAALAARRRPASEQESPDAPTPDPVREAA